ncbi:Phytochrome-like protein cph2 [Halomonas sp. THAF5a]|uniref:bifunctional diguanylate cyclase/phosphodiesterase n=1 Tax=Halomonas sp. THAF5a TaxID=2587844 RepID=UPI0012A92E4C|nr:EAL domain-containing protein [Halomonas sp. THAF5a]QFU01600.1 Phytochrome-like protein cph2 [Halomonas sp. THAF5a]
MESSYQELEAQQGVQEMIAMGRPLEETLRAICLMVEGLVEGSKCYVMLVDDRGKTLSLAASGSLPRDCGLRLKNIPVSPKAGSCDTAAFFSEACASADRRRSDQWADLCDAAIRHGLLSGWSHPIRSKSGVLLGTVATCSRSPGQPDDRHAALMRRAAGLASLAIGRDSDHKVLERNRNRYEALFSHNPDAVFTLDVEGCFESLNAATTSLLDAEEGDILATAFVARVPEAHKAMAEQYLGTALSGATSRFECELASFRHRESVALLTFVPITARGEVIGVHGIAKDITARRADEHALRIFRRSVEATPNSVVIVDANAKGQPIIHANPAFYRMTGYGKEETIGKNCRFLQGKDTSARSIDRIRLALSKGASFRETILNYRKDGTVFWNDLHVAPVRDEYGAISHFIGIQNNISEKQHYQDQLAYFTTHNPLTHLPNKSNFLSKLEYARRVSRQHGARVALLYIDLDDFKKVNESLGHSPGDAIIVEASRRITRCLGKNDVLAHFVADEFVVLLHDVRAESEAVTLSQAILDELRLPYIVADHEVDMPASIGISIDNDDTEGDIVRHANMAMLRAKESGKNTYHWHTHAMSQSVEERLTLGRELKHALKHDELELHYQPIIPCRAEGKTYLEALVRWNSPARGYISPGRFIPLAEEIGLIPSIGNWVLERACKDMAFIAAHHAMTVSVAVNVSPLQFDRDDFLPYIERCLNDNGLAPGSLEIEITEGLIMQGEGDSVEKLRALKRIGVNASIDDFGTGYSSLSYLKNLPVSKVKIDKAFIDGVSVKKEDSTIVRATIAMAQKLGFQVVAEGVEYRSQRDFLLEEHCDFIQGFLHSRPLPLNETVEYLSRMHASA